MADIEVADGGAAFQAIGEVQQEWSGVQMHGWETRMLRKHYLEQGVSKTELPRRFGVGRRSIHRWVETGQLDRDLEGGGAHYRPRPAMAHKLDPYKGIIEADWRSFSGYRRSGCTTRFRRPAGPAPLAPHRGRRAAPAQRLCRGRVMRAEASNRRDRLREMLADLVRSLLYCDKRSPPTPSRDAPAPAAAGEWKRKPDCQAHRQTDAIPETEKSGKRHSGPPFEIGG